MIDIILATKNIGKKLEFEKLLENLPINLLTLNDFSDIPEIIEYGKTFQDNSLIKAKTVANLKNIITLADDSGLCVQYLNGAPGVYSSRYAGIEKNDDLNNQKLLNELLNVPIEHRQAKFICALTIVIPQKEPITCVGEIEGIILPQPQGDTGFGYDPLFYLPKLNKTMAQLTQQEKNRISHRAKAFEKALPIISDLIFNF